MFFEILASIFLSIRNILLKEIPSSVETLDVICLTAIIWGVIGSLVYSFFSANSISSNISHQLVSYAVIGFLAQIIMQYAFLKSDNIAMTAGILSTNIVFTLLLDSLFSSELKANRKQLLGILFIIMGTALTK
tara:strand:+ start:145 stop:543 length:399 start_codon:yes stop_codon:yes gene_type:complete